MTTRRSMQREYGINYDKIIAYEHLWDLPGVCREIQRSGRFHTIKKLLLPSLIPLHHMNLVACLKCCPRK